MELIKKIWFSGREAYGQDKENSILGIKLNAGGIA
jgi:hypothetical protein